MINYSLKTKTARPARGRVVGVVWLTPITILLLATPAAAQSFRFDVKEGIDRPGNDLTSFDVAGKNIYQCIDACRQTTLRCAAFSARTTLPVRPSRM
jgi:hypothetical protein